MAYSGRDPWGGRGLHYGRRGSGVYDSKLYRESHGLSATGTWWQKLLATVIAIFSFLVLVYLIFGVSIFDVVDLLKQFNWI